jgi:hypothetical protein
VKANKDTRKRLNGSTEPKRLEEERERLINQVSGRAGPTFSFSFRLELHKEPWRR